jgi:hypothetical protein
MPRLDGLPARSLEASGRRYRWSVRRTLVRGSYSESAANLLIDKGLNFAIFSE